MKSFKKIAFSLAAFLCFVTANAAIDAETEGMEAAFRGDGTFLVAGPTFIWERPSGSDGIHSANELWSPEKLRLRLFLNRFSGTPSWTPQAPGVWMKTGNEIGDMIYQDLLTDENETNRTPILEAGFVSPSVAGFWATARLFQVDHYSSAAYSERKKWIGSMEYAWFGENLPLFSTAYGGLGYTQGKLNASVLVGKEYLWIYGESGRWIPVTYSPRVEGRVDYGPLQATVTYEKGEFENKAAHESGTREEVNGSLYYSCDKACRSGMLQAGAGAAFRATRDDGDVYFGLEDDFVAWPFIELRFSPEEHFVVSANFGANDRDWLLQDSLEFRFFPGYDTDILFGIGNRAGTRLNPLGDTYEFFDGDTLDLAPSGYFQLHRAYFDVNGNANPFTLGGRIAGWIEEGAETFDTLYVEGSKSNPLRKGDVSRIKSWIYGASGEVRASYAFEKLFKLEARGGMERISGPEKRFEVNPAEGWVSFVGYWNFSDYLRVTQSVNYRSDARWNLRSADPLVVKGAWYWNITAEENFPEWGLTLTGTLLHIIGNDNVQVPGGGVDRTRFYCGVRKNF